MLGFGDACLSWLFTRDFLSFVARSPPFWKSPVYFLSHRLLTQRISHIAINAALYHIQKEMKKLTEKLINNSENWVHAGHSRKKKKSRLLKIEVIGVLATSYSYSDSFTALTEKWTSLVQKKALISKIGRKWPVLAEKIFLLTKYEGLQHACYLKGCI